jgi:hypothetical protein
VRLSKKKPITKKGLAEVVQGVGPEFKKKKKKKEIQNTKKGLAE